jgi:2-haloacid dehalogenase
MESQPSALPPSAPRAVLFDAYGTLFDVYSVALLAEQLFPGQGQRLAVLWRDKQIEYTRLVTTCNDGAHYRPFWDLTRAALVFAIKSIAAKDLFTLGNGQFDAQVDQLMNQYRHLSAFPENRDVLTALKARGVVTGILSNGDPAMLGIALRSSGLDGLLDHVISVDPVRRYKTHPDAYALGPRSHRLQGRADGFCQLQRLGRAGRHLVRFSHAVGEPQRPAVRGTGHPTHPHRHRPARRAGVFP